MSVEDAETQFDIDEFNDLYAKTKPTLYIKMSDIFSIHSLVATEILVICPNQDDILRQVVRDLGNAKTNESELSGVSSTEITLTLNPKFHAAEGKKSDLNSIHKHDILIGFRSRCGGQDSIHGDQKMRAVHHSSSVWSKSYGYHGQTYLRRG